MKVFRKNPNTIQTTRLASDQEQSPNSHYNVLESVFHRFTEPPGETGPAAQTMSLSPIMYAQKLN